MNLGDFEKTSYSGLYVSKAIHPVFGKKYIARFQYNKKRYVKVLGYTKKDDLTTKTAYQELQKYKKEIMIKVDTEALLENSDVEVKSTKAAPQSSEKEQSSTKVEKTEKVEKIVEKVVEKSVNTLKIDGKNIKTDKVVEEYTYMKEILGNYSNVDATTLQEGIQKIYDLEELKKYQIELIKMQNYLETTNKKMIILFEGRDASGKGGAIRRITRYMNNKHYRVVALGKPTDTQRSQWFFQRYIEHFPTGGEVVLFDRSWYNRAMVEPIFGFCTQEQYEIFMEDVVNFEHDLVRQDTILIKLYFSVSKDEQARRFERRMSDPLRQWKFSEVDMQAQDLWVEFSEKKYEMLKRTSSRTAPWHIVRSDNKHLARLEAMKIILNSVNYDGRNYSLDFEPNEQINISVQKELARMRKKQDY